MSGEVVKSVQNIADLVGMNKVTIYGWMKRGCPRNEDGSFDVDAVRRWMSRQKLKPKSIASNKRRKKTTQLVELCAYTDKRPREIAELTGLPEKNVSKIWKLVKKYGKDIIDYKAKKADIFAVEQMRYMEFITDDKLEEASARDLAQMAKMAWEKERVESGESVDNVAIVVKHIKELKAQRDAESD